MKSTKEQNPTNEYTPYKRVPKKEFVHHVTPEGNKTIYLVELSNDGEKQIAELGKEVDWDAYIQANAESCDLQNIVARYLQGDASVINVGNPYSGDVASMPKNINEVQDLGHKIEQGYENLSDEIKAIFGGSFEQFYAAVLNNQVESTINAYAAAKVAEAKKATQAAEQAEEGK